MPVIHNINYATFLNLKNLPISSLRFSLFVVALQYFGLSFSFAQSANIIEPLDTLTTHVTRQHAQQTRQALDNFKNLKDYKWLHLIPSIGYDTRWNTPVVSVSSSQFINYYQRKDDKKYRMIQLEQQADTDLEKTLFNLKGLYNRLLKQLDELETRHQIMNINRQLFEIEEQKHKNIEIDTEDFLKSQRSYLSQLSDYQNFKLSIHQTISEIENITKRTLLLQAPLL